MRIHVSKEGDTLRKLAAQYDFPLDLLSSLNPHIENTDAKININSTIKIPAMEGAAAERKQYSPPFEAESPYLDHWIPLTPIEKMAQTDYDVLIVGSGAGGGAALWRLCQQWGRNGKKIGLVEAGDLLLPTHGGNLATFNGDSLFAYKTYHSTLHPYMEPVFPNLLRVKALGGRTLFWASETPRFHPSKFISWPFPYSELEPYYVIAEQIMNVTDSYTENSPINEILLNRARFGGFKDAATIPMAVDLDATKFGQVHSNVFFSSIAFLAYALNIRPFDLTVNTPAVQVFTEKGKAAGIKVITPDKKTYSLSAKTVILSASTYETPRILLNSNIPGEAIGRFLTDHPYILSYAEANRDQFPEQMGISKIYVPSNAERQYQLLCIGPGFYPKYMEIPFKDKLRFRLHNYGVVEPRLDNRVRISPNEKDANGVPDIDIDFSFSNQDRVLIDEMLKALHSFIDVLQLTVVDTPALQAPGAINHESGTCRMGIDPALSATNQYGQIHGVPGLYVADNSVLPLTTGANPTLTTIALAIRTADHIIESTTTNK